MPASRPQHDVPAASGGPMVRVNGTRWMLLGSFLAGLGAYLFQLVGTRALGEVGYAPISSLWTIQYLVLSTFLYSIETYVTREAVLGRLRAETARRTFARLWLWILVVAGALTAVTWAFRAALFARLADLPLVVGLTVVTMGAFVLVRGRLAGAGRFRAYGLVTATESLARLAAAVAVVTLMAATTRTLAWVLPLGALVATAWWVMARRRGLGAAEAVPAAPRLASGRFLALTTGANAIAQVLLAGGPLVLVFLAAPPAEVSVFFVTVTAARVPIVLALGGVLSRLLPAFVGLARTQGPRALARVAPRVAAGALAVAAAGAAAGALVGSRVVALLFGAAFAPPSWLVAGTAAGMVLATGAMTLNQLLVAQGIEQRLAGPWLAALVAAGATIGAVAGPASARVTAGFVAGELVALAGLTIAAWRHHPTGVAR